MIKSRVSWTYKFFWCHRVGKIIRCRYQVKHANYWLPRSFIWTKPDLVPDLHAYIDTITDQRTTDAAAWEINGSVVEVEREEPPAGVEMVRVDPTLLCALLRGEYVLDIPVTSRLVCASNFRDLNRYIPVEASAALIAADSFVKKAYIQKVREMAAAGQPLFYMPEPVAEGKLKEWGIKPYMPGMQRIEAGKNAGVSVAAETPVFDGEEKESAPAAEDIEISRIDHGSHFEIISMIHGVQTYYCRRLVRSGKQIWCGTSFSPSGPWRVFEEDRVLLAAIEECAV